MVVCQYFLRGTCKFGDNCRNEHPTGRDATGTRQTGNQSWPSGTSQDRNVPLFTSDSMAKDFTPQGDKPLWPLSSYGPSKSDVVLISNLDESPEELRFRAVTATQAGALNDYLKYESDKITAADQIYANARANVSQAYEQAVKQSTSSVPAQTVIASSATGTAFGGTTSAFGQPSSFGALGKAAPTPSAFGGGSVSMFGSTTAPTSVFGKSGFSQSAFGQTVTPASTSAFTQPTSAFGPNPPQSSFIKPASGAFGTTSSGQSAFSNTNTNTNTGGSGGGFSVFAGPPSAFGTGAMANDAPPPSGSAFGSFGNPPLAPSGFAVPAASQGSTVSAFGAPSAFGALAQGATSVFGGSAFSSSSNPTGYAFGPGSTSGPFTNSNQVSSPFAPRPQNPPTSAFAPTEPSQPPSNTQPPTSSFVLQQAGPSLPTKVQAGPPDFANAKSTYKPGVDKYDSLLPDNYLQLLPKVAREAFESQKFVWGRVPEWIPPKELR